MQFDIEKFNKALEFFRASFVEHWKEEKYKWQAVKHFQDNWNIKAEDFSAMFEKATKKTKNLLDSQNFLPRGMILEFSKENSEKTRQMFEILFDETKVLSERIENFKKIADELQASHNQNNASKWKSHFQTDNAISTYLWLHFPEKYYIYKWSEYRNVARELDCSVKFTKGHKENLENGFALYDLISEELSKDEELKNLLKSKLTDDCYSDGALKTLTIDFGFHISRYYNDGEWLPKDYNPGISKEQWIELINDKTVFNDNSLVTFACIQNAKVATCADMAKEFGRTWQFYNNNGWQTGQRVFNKIGKQPPKDENDEVWLWSACCCFRKNVYKLWEFKIYPELQEAFDETGILDDIELHEKGESEMTDRITEYKNLLLNTHNLILHGAPGTGKTHLAKEIAEAMGAEVGFVQFHPSYDYTDFVEGLRPVNSNNGQIGFERKDGVFKKFCERALENQNVFTEDNFNESYQKLLDKLDEAEELGKPIVYETLSHKKKFAIESNSLQNIYAIPQTESQTHMPITKDSIRTYLRTGEISDWKPYLTAIAQHLIDDFGYEKKNQTSQKKPFIFIIDEINRGEMSKIFGELFFAIEPSYRGAKKCNNLRTQYANLQETPNIFDSVLGEKEDYGHFFIPENVYIIGTMNDIDRSVESMDFAFRRRFTFKEVKANENLGMLNELDESIREKAKQAFFRLNNKIWHKPIDNEPENKRSIAGLSSAYHIGGAYFLKLKELGGDFGKLWEYHLEGLLREYLRGMEDAEKTLEQLKEAYDKAETSSDAEEAKN